jgi:CheY-like chemotaxis protein
MTDSSPARPSDRNIARFRQFKQASEFRIPSGGNPAARELKRRGHEIPIIFITASTDKTVRPQLLELGAVECLFKPFSDTALLEALRVALRGN